MWRIKELKARSVLSSFKSTEELLNAIVGYPKEYYRDIWEYMDVLRGDLFDMPDGALTICRKMDALKPGDKLFIPERQLARSVDTDLFLKVIAPDFEVYKHVDMGEMKTTYVFTRNNNLSNYEIQVN